MGNPAKPPTSISPPRNYLRRQTAAVAGGAFALAIGVVLFAAITLRISYRDAEESAALTGDNLARVLSQEVAITIQGVDAALRRAMAAVEGRVPDAPPNDPAVRMALTTVAIGTPMLSGIIIVDSSGYLAHDARTPVEPRRFNFSDRPYFAVHRDNPGAGLFVDKPYLARVGGQHFIAISRRIVRRPDGEFLGVAAAISTSTRLAETFAAVNLGPQSAVTLWRDDGTIMARSGASADLIGQTFPDLELVKRLHESPHGSFKGFGRTDSIQRRISYRRVEGLPLAVSVALAEDDYLAGWRRDFWNVVALAGLLAAAIGGVALMAIVALRRHHVSQTALREYAAHLRGVLDNISDAVITIDDRGRILSFNPAAEGMFGYRASEVAGRNVAMLMAEPDSSRHDDYLRRYLETGERRIIGTAGREVTARRKDRTIFPAELSVGEMELDGRKVFVGAISDITGRKALESDLRRRNLILEGLGQSQSRYLEGANQRSVMQDMLAYLLPIADSQYGFLGEVFQDQGGRPYMQMRAVTDLTHDQASGGFFSRHRWEEMRFDNPGSLIGAVMTGARPVIANDPASDTRRAGLPPGHPPLTAFLGLPIMSGDSLIGVIGIANRPGGYNQDIVALLAPLVSTCASLIQAGRAETMRRNVEEARKYSEEQLRLVTDAVPALIAYVDKDRVFRMINRTGEEWYERPASTIVGHHVRDVLGTTNYDSLKPLIDAVLTGEPVHRIRETSYFNGRPQTVEIRYVPDRSENGEVRGFVGLVEDVTERRATEAKLQQAQKMEAVGQLTGGIAHDFNNILAVIVGNLDLLQERAKERADLVRLVRRALESADKGAALTQRLLAFSRQQTLLPRDIKVGGLLEGLGEMLERTLDQRIAVKVMAETGLWRCLADPSQLENAILNLAINARDAMPEGGRLTIEATNARLDDRFGAELLESGGGDYVAISVTDTGTGMTPEVAARAFDPFFTTKPTGKGSGLGLSMVHGFVRQSGGHVRIYSEPGHGTTITMYLPRARTAGEEAPAPDTSDQRFVAGSATAASGGQGEAILVVEDNPGVKDFVSEALQSLGYRPLMAHDGNEALALLQREPQVALLFTDVILPGGLNGIEIAEQARKIRPGLKVLFTSGYPDQALRGRQEVPEEFALLHKPYRKQELARQIARIFNRAEQ